MKQEFQFHKSKLIAGYYQQWKEVLLLNAVRGDFKEKTSNYLTLALSINFSMKMFNFFESISW